MSPISKYNLQKDIYNSFVLNIQDLKQLIYNLLMIILMTIIHKFYFH